MGSDTCLYYRTWNSNLRGLSRLQYMNLKFWNDSVLQSSTSYHNSDHILSWLIIPKQRQCIRAAWKRLCGCFEHLCCMSEHYRLDSTHRSMISHWKNMSSSVYICGVPYACCSAYMSRYYMLSRWYAELAWCYTVFKFCDVVLINWWTFVF